MLVHVVCHHIELSEPDKRHIFDTQQKVLVNAAVRERAARVVKAGKLGITLHIDPLDMRIFKEPEQWGPDQKEALQHIVPHLLFSLREDTKGFHP